MIVFYKSLKIWSTRPIQQIGKYSTSYWMIYPIKKYIFITVFSCLLKCSFAISQHRFAVQTGVLNENIKQVQTLTLRYLETLESLQNSPLNLVFFYNQWWIGRWQWSTPYDWTLSLFSKEVRKKASARKILVKFVTVTELQRHSNGPCHWAANLSHLCLLKAAENTSYPFDFSDIIYCFYYFILTVCFL